MARGEASITCPHCGSYSRIPMIALQRDKYHCSRCGKHIPLSTVHPQGVGETPSPSGARPARHPFHRRRGR